MERCSDYLALSPRAAAARLPSPAIVLGDGVAACLPFLSDLGRGLRVAPASHSMPRAAVVGQLGYAMLTSGQAVTADALAPFYLRPLEADLDARRA